MTGLKSYRSVVWRPFPRTGVLELFTTWEDFNSYELRLIRTGCIDNGKRTWWDIRPHPFFSTIEFRIFDMPATLDDTLAIAALYQALVAKVSWLNQRDEILPMLSSSSSMKTNGMSCALAWTRKWSILSRGCGFPAPIYP